ncbi:MAG: mannitol dehydrogenase family protein [Oscillospiraceae bacterium]|nr:mannitol dehydrogenase family protein [Oscillospiraceae bacterium]
MKLSDAGLCSREAWVSAGIRLPAFDRQAMRAETEAHPTWVHFGPGNLFRAFHAPLQQSLLEQGLVSGGIYAVKIYKSAHSPSARPPHDDLSILVTLLPDGGMEKSVVASVAGSLCCDPGAPEDYARLKEIFRSPSLQLATFTITEKGYALTGLDGSFTTAAEADFAAGPHRGKLAMSKTAALLLERFAAGGAPLAMDSTDNCSHNGELFRRSVLTVAEQWRERGMVPGDFVSWLSDESRVAFPWTMIDKITPRPSERVAKALAADGVEDMEITVTPRGSYSAPFANAEQPQYLVIEDRFPNGRPPLEQAGVYFTDRDTVNAVEKMKVSTCLNPLHTALAVYGCLLGYTSIAEEMQDPLLRALTEGIGYREGLPVVTDPGILQPAAFLREVIERRLPNPYMPDTPQRIAADSSQKIPIRFGETIRSYLARPERDAGSLTCIPLALAGWLRYLLAVDDGGLPFECSSDPMLGELQAKLSSVRFGKPDSASRDVLAPILSNAALFGVDLEQAGLAGKIAGMLREMLEGPGAVRRTLRRYLG